MIVEVSTVVLFKSDRFKSGFGIVVDEESCLPTETVEDDEELLDVAVRLVYQYSGLDVPLDCMYKKLDIRDNIDRKDDRVVCVPYMVIGTDPGPDFLSVDLTDLSAFDHRSIVRDAFATARRLMATTTVGAFLLGNEFTVQDYRRLCEQIMNDGSEMKVYSIHPSNFRRKFEGFCSTSLTFVPTGDTVTGKGGTLPLYSALAACPFTELPSKLF